jgi:hypothetical protein
LALGNETFFQAAPEALRRSTGPGLVAEIHKLVAGSTYSHLRGAMVLDRLWLGRSRLAAVMGCDAADDCGIFYETTIA